MKNTILYLFMFFLFTGLKCKKENSEPTEYITITGHYYNSQCQPIANKALVLHGYLLPSLLSKSEYVGVDDTTGADGSFSFKVPKGNYTHGSSKGLILSAPGVIGGVLVTEIPAVDGTNFNYITNEKVKVTIKVKDSGNKIHAGDTLYYILTDISGSGITKKKIIQTPSQEFVLCTDSVYMFEITKDKYIGSNQTSPYSRNVRLIWGIGVHKYANCTGGPGEIPSATCNIVTTTFEECGGQKELIINVP